MSCALSNSCTNPLRIVFRFDSTTPSSLILLLNVCTCTVAGFGAVKQLREGEEARRTRLGYSFIVKEREGKVLTITPKHGVTEGCMTHAINHTCHPGFVNCRFVHAGIVGGRSEDEEGGIGGRRTSEVFVKTTRRVESHAELFANYGTKFRFAGGCVCHSCRPIEP